MKKLQMSTNLFLCFMTKLSEVGIEILDDVEKLVL